MSKHSSGTRPPRDPTPSEEPLAGTNPRRAVASGWTARYRAGEREQVWREMREAGEAVRDAGVVEHARAVAVETMTSVRRNVETVRDRLTEAGYRFQAGTDEVHVPPTPDTPAMLEEFLAKAWMPPGGTYR
jgi:hypothetical protein